MSTYILFAIFGFVVGAIFSTTMESKLMDDRIKAGRYEPQWCRVLDWAFRCQSKAGGEGPMSEWIEHHGSKFAPVADWISVDVITNRGRIMENEPAGIWDWARDGSDFIVAYRPHNSSKATSEPHQEHRNTNDA